MTHPSDSRIALGTRTRDGWVVGRVRSVPVLLSPSWFVIAAVIGLATYAILGRAMQVTTGEHLTVALLAPVFLLLSVLAHELAHGLTGHAVGSPPKEYVLTLVGGHTQFHEEMRSPGASALVSVAGPAANAVMAVAAWGITAALNDPVAIWLGYLVALTNGAVAVFNLLPAHPLDGGRLVEALIWRVSGDLRRGQVLAAWGGRVVAIALVVIVVLRPLMAGGRPSIVTLLWATILAGHLWISAGSALRTLRAQNAVHDLDLRTLAAPVTVIGPRSTVDDLDDIEATLPNTTVLVDVPPSLALIDFRAADAVPGPLRPHTAVSSVMMICPPQALIHGSQGATAVAQVARAAGAGARVVVLMEGEQPIGALSVDTLASELKQL